MSGNPSNSVVESSLLGPHSVSELTICRRTIKTLPVLALNPNRNSTPRTCSFNPRARSKLTCGRQWMWSLMHFKFLVLSHVTGLQKLHPRVVWANKSLLEDVLHLVRSFEKRRERKLFFYIYEVVHSNEWWWDLNIYTIRRMFQGLILDSLYASVNTMKTLSVYTRVWTALLQSLGSNKVRL